jgi:hypothetical protein
MSLTYVFFLSAVLAFSGPVAAANKLCLQVIEKMVGPGNDKEKMLSCLNPVMDQMEAHLTKEKYRHEISKNALLELTPIYENFQAVMGFQKSLIVEWEKIFSNCNGSPRNQIACSDLELDLFDLYKKMGDDLQVAKSKLKPFCEKSESPDQDAYRKWLCEKVEDTLTAQRVDLLRYVKERFAKFWTAP